ncbi:MAG: 6-phosphogluconolactonase [Solirubrobacteraceae bacterium]|nr:6-phosphogluconolactonase [Solirubrobacteraceae bacterium]
MSGAPRLRVFDDAEGVAAYAAETIAAAIDGARHEGSELHVALAGGTTPRRAYELLAGVDGSWAHVHLWLGDERCVPDDDPESNARMVREALLTARRAAPPVLHAVPFVTVAEDAAWGYGRELLEHMPDAVFDIVVLGMGPDGHTCSLFPGHPVLDVREAPVAAVRASPKPPPERVTLTLPVLRRARFTLLLATGSEKRDALAAALAGDRSIPLALLGDGLDEVACDAAAAPDGC